MDKNIECDYELERISKKISFFLINPNNTKEEKIKFLKTPGYNPQFTYNDSPHNLSKIRFELERISPENNIIGDILRGIRDKYLLDIELIEKRGGTELTDVSIRLHGQPSDELIKKAEELVKLDYEPEKIKYETKQIIKKLRIAFLKYGFHWSVEENEMVASAAVGLKQKKLLIKKDSRFSENFLKRIIVHEIGTHIMRAENGKNQPYRFFARGMPGYLKTEEGLAVYNEELHNCLNNKLLKIYAGRVLAIKKALNYSFYDCYTYLREYFAIDTAWRLTLRAKRGLSDTKNKGAFTKDIAYLEGYMAVKKFIEEGGNINNLYYGKIGIEHIPILSKIPSLINPKMLPMMRYLNYFKGHFEGLMDSFVFLDSLELDKSFLKLD